MGNQNYIFKKINIICVFLYMAIFVAPVAVFGQETNFEVRIDSFFGAAAYGLIYVITPRKVTISTSSPLKNHVYKNGFQTTI
jgi:hypothetical protein